MGVSNRVDWRPKSLDLEVRETQYVGASSIWMLKSSKITVEPKTYKEIMSNVPLSYKNK